MRHAWERMTSLGFTTQDIVDTITEPLWTRPNGPRHPQVAGTVSPADRSITCSKQPLVDQGANSSTKEPALPQPV